MSEQRKTVTEEDLDRFADERLDAERRQQVAAYLAENEEAAEEVEAYRRLNAALRAEYGPLVREPVPPALLRAATAGRVRPRVSLGRTLWIAAVIALSIVVGGIGGWLWRDAATKSATGLEFARQAAIAHLFVYAPEVPNPVDVAGGGQAELRERLSQWLGSPVVAPRLGGVGYRLIGARLLPSSEGPAVQLIYENASDRQIAIYLRTNLRNTSEAEYQFARESDVDVLYWLNGPRGFALSGDVDRDDMVRIAEVVYDQLGP